MTMYLEHFGLREAPFKITPHTEFFFAGANRGETLEALIYAITSGEGIVKVTGEVGAGKTMLCRVLMERLPKSVETIYFAVPSLSPDELIATVASDLGVETDGVNITKLIRALQVRLIEIYGSGKRVVALIDEAHAMPVETLDQIRLLSNLETSHEKLMQIVLFGQPELDQHLSMPNIRQLKERITHSFNLLPLPARDIKDYLNFRLRAAGYRGPDLFSPESLKLIAEASEGLTRRINIYADKTLLAAFAAGTHTITTDHVRAAIADTQIVMTAPKSNQKKFAFAIVTSALIAAALGFVVGQYSTPAIDRLPASAKPLPTAALPAATVLPINKVPAADIASVATPAQAAAVVPEPKVTAAKSESALPITETPGTPKNAPATQPAAAAPTIMSVAGPPSLENANETYGADWLRKRMASDAIRVAAMPKERFGIQLMTADERRHVAIESYLRPLRSEVNTDLIMLLPTGSAKDPRVTVLFGNFVGPADAASALRTLPAGATRFRPYIISFGAFRSDLRPLTP